MKVCLFWYWIKYNLVNYEVEILLVILCIFYCYNIELIDFLVKIVEREKEREIEKERDLIGIYVIVILEIICILILFFLNWNFLINCVKKIV